MRKLTNFGYLKVIIGNVLTRYYDNLDYQITKNTKHNFKNSLLIFQNDF